MVGSPYHNARGREAVGSISSFLTSPHPGPEHPQTPPPLRPSSKVRGGIRRQWWRYSLSVGVFGVCNSSCGVGASGLMSHGWVGGLHQVFLSFFLRALATNEVDQYR